MNLANYTNRLFVALGKEIDAFKFFQMSTNEKFEELNKSNGLIYVEVSSLKKVSELTQAFIKYYDLGASNFIGGNVIDENMNFVAHISYNGRVWDNEIWLKAKEIELC